MRKILTGLAVIAIASIARAMMPDAARADEYDPNAVAGKWGSVCCGSCPTDYCLGNGSYTCCK
jgi:hypothetical protein